MPFPDPSTLTVTVEAAVRSTGSREVSAAAQGAGTDWMRVLSEHYAQVRLDHPDDELCVVFDIDGTILDTRHLVVHVLLAYDRSRGSDLFRGLVADDVTDHEDHIEKILESLAVPLAARGGVVAFYREHLWDREAVLAAGRPFEGVLGVIRWFQLQPNTHVALNTGRSHRMRWDTLESLNQIGQAYRVRFPPELLFTAAEGEPVPRHKVAAIDELGRRGLRVVAVVDNEPENLAAMAAADRDEGILFLHADTIFESQRRHQEQLVTGRDYRLGALVPARSFPQRVTFVWHGVNDGLNLDGFLASDVAWAEVDVRRDPSGRLVLRHDGFEETPWRREEPTLLAADTVTELAAAGRSVKLDLKEGGATLAETIRLVEGAGLGDERVWFNAELQNLGPAGFNEVRDRFPRSTISCPLDFLVPLILASETATDHVLEFLRVWGVSRLSFRWSSLVRRVLDDIEARGWQVNLYGVSDLEEFLEASLLLPTSVTADFNFPEWGYYGRGSGEGG